MLESVERDFKHKTVAFICVLIVRGMEIVLNLVGEFVDKVFLRLEIYLLQSFKEVTDV